MIQQLSCGSSVGIISGGGGGNVPHIPVLHPRFTRVSRAAPSIPKFAPGEFVEPASQLIPLTTHANKKTTARVVLLFGGGGNRVALGHPWPSRQTDILSATRARRESHPNHLQQIKKPPQGWFCYLVEAASNS